MTHHKVISSIENSFFNYDPLPSFELTNLMDPSQVFSDKELKGKVTVLNIWASWCPACQSEHAFLMDISQRTGIPFYSLNFKDNPDAARKWLEDKGNPFIKTGIDAKGNLSAELGIIGIPETFLVDKNGMIRYRHLGVLDQEEWENTLQPLIVKYSKNENDE